MTRPAIDDILHGRVEGDLAHIVVALARYANSLERLLWEVSDSGLARKDPRIEVQVDSDTWAEIGRWRDKFFPR